MHACAKARDERKTRLQCLEPGFCPERGADELRHDARCPTCGEATALLVCASCGVELSARLSAADLGDRDQTASDEDQTWSDHDQTASDRDRRSAEDDQDAADEDLAAGGATSTYR